MSTEKSSALVIRVIDFSETSCVVTLMTREFGKITALAKGARRPKGPFESAIDLLALCRVVFIHKTSDALDLLTEAKLERRFRASTRDLVRLYAGYYVAELLAELTDEADPHPDLFDAAVWCLQGLDGDAEVVSLTLWFELTALQLLGHLPSWAQCVGCGAEVPITDRVPFGLLAGGVLCNTCRVGQKRVVGVRPETLRLLAEFSTAEARLPLPEVPRQQRGELRGLVNQWMANHLGRQPRMHKYLKILAE